MVERPDWVMVIGGADCVWWDVAQLEKIAGKAWPGYVIAVNDVGVWWKREIHGWASLHSDKLLHNAREHGRDAGSWIEQREKRGLPGGFTTFGKNKKHSNDVTIDLNYGGGSSGLLAAVAGRHMVGGAGVGKIVVCGCPLSSTPHFAESHSHSPTKKWTASKAHFNAWQRHKEDLARDVRSMSGRTRQLLGYPTEDWLHG